MSYAHITIATTNVAATATFLQEALGYTRAPRPANSPAETVWLALGHDQQMHIVHVDGFMTSAFEGEFGRHIAVRQPLSAFATVKRTLERLGAEVFPPLRPSAVERFFFREPINGYVFEVVDQDGGAAISAMTTDD